tara:strand:+ start:123 stop:563 length:441 start_codon:yes stop_codon:yes gene_type:complete
MTAKKRKVKKRDRRWYLEKLVTKAKLCVKDRDGYICQHCNKECSGRNCHASHILNVGTHKSFEIDPSNMKVLCSYCHLRWWHKDVLHATEWFRGKFPERYTYLMEACKEKWKIPTSSLINLHKNTKGDGSDYAEKYYKLIKEIINA